MAAMPEPPEQRVLDTVVFDLGGVLADWDPRYLYRELFEGDEARVEHFLTDVATPEWNHAMDAGRDRAEAVTELVALHPDHAAAIRAWVDRWDDMLGPEIAGTAEVVDELAALGVRLLALTNWSAETFPAARERFPSFRRFEAIVVSGEHGLAKPDPALYAVLIDSHGVRPERTVYVDDKEVNVEAARTLGMTGLLFTDPTTLRADLVRLGVLRAGPLGQDVAVPDEPSAAQPSDPAVWRDDAVPAGAGPSVVTIGVFDGVHRGHQIVVGRAAARARAAGVPCVAITFDPNPADVVGRGEPQPRLGSVDERVRLLHAAGADAVWVLPFTTELSQLTPEQFVADMLVARLAPVAVVVGADFRFGHRAAGTVDTLRDLGATHGFAVEEVPLVGRDDPEAPAAWSSTAVRGLLAEGRVDGATEALGHPYRIEGQVVHGDHRGRELGFPTANLAVDPQTALPADGVYAAVLERAGGERLPAAVSVGTNPTFDGTVRRVEAYVLDVDPAEPLDLYGEHVTVEPVARLRGMTRFDSVDELVAQMGADVDAARRVLSAG